MTKLRLGAALVLAAVVVAPGGARAGDGGDIVRGILGLGTAIYLNEQQQKQQQQRRYYAPQTRQDDHRQRVVRDAHADERRADRMEIQRRLNLLGFDAGRPDGIFGPQTRRAIAGFQRRIGHNGDGSISRAEIAMLYEQSNVAMSGGYNGEENAFAGDASAGAAAQPMPPVRGGAGETAGDTRAASAGGFPALGKPDGGAATGGAFPTIGGSPKPAAGGPVFPALVAAPGPQDNASAFPAIAGEAAPDDAAAPRMPGLAEAPEGTGPEMPGLAAAPDATKPAPDMPGIASAPSADDPAMPGIAGAPEKGGDAMPGLGDAPKAAVPGMPALGQAPKAADLASVTLESEVAGTPYGSMDKQPTLLGITLGQDDKTVATALEEAGLTTCETGTGSTACRRSTETLADRVTVWSHDNASWAIHRRIEFARPAPVDLVDKQFAASYPELMETGRRIVSSGPHCGQQLGDGVDIDQTFNRFATFIDASVDIPTDAISAARFCPVAYMLRFDNRDEKTVAAVSIVFLDMTAIIRRAATAAKKKEDAEKAATEADESRRKQLSTDLKL